MKQLVKDIQALPSKRLYLSIIADYHIKSALCELIDNAIDNWIYNGKKAKLIVSIELDFQRQVIQVTDNSGGIKETDLNLIVSPGHSKNTAEDPTIGIFGVGSKRAVVALAEEIRIYSRYKKEDTLLVEINDAWLKDDDTWDLPIYKVDHIPINTTIIELVKLRDPILSEIEQDLHFYFGATYALFIGSLSLELQLNSSNVEAQTFDKWSYPPNFEPKQFIGELNFGDKGTVGFDILGGLTKSGEPSGGEYGLYLYCNDRMVTQAFKGAEIGYRPLKIGNPHPSVSLARVIVKLKGSAQLMPWNSSKSEINTRHPTFKALQEHIDKVLTHYSTLSKKWSTAGGWDENIFKYESGEIRALEVSYNNPSQIKLYLPPIPRPSRKRYSDIIKSNNRSLVHDKPWVVGLYEAVIAVEEITKLKLDQKNRIALLTLDSMLEIAFKEYLINDSGNSYSASRLENIMKNRVDVHKEVQQTVPLTANHWKKIEYYYKLRSELVHKRATVTITDNDLSTFRKTVEYTLTKMFGLSFKSE